jgi:hypothetical protein
MGVLTPIPPRLQTIIHILIILILLHAHDHKVGEVTIHLDLLLLQHGVLGRLRAAGQHHARVARLDGAAGDLVCIGLARGGELSVAFSFCAVLRESASFLFSDVREVFVLVRAAMDLLSEAISEVRDWRSVICCLRALITASWSAVVLVSAKGLGLWIRTLSDLLSPLPQLLEVRLLP